MSLPPISDKGRPSNVSPSAATLTVQQQQAQAGPPPSTPLFGADVLTAPPQVAARKGLSAAQVRAIASVFQYADINNDGTLDFEEMRSLLLDLGYPAADEDVQRVMKQLDSGGDGKIQWKEFKKGQALWESSGSAPAAPSATGGAPTTARRKSVSATVAAAAAVPTGPVEPDAQLVEFFDQLGLYEPDAIQSMARSGLTFNQLFQLSCFPRDLAHTCGEMGLGKVSTDRIKRALAQLRNMRAVNGRKMAVVISVSKYNDVRICQPGHSNADADDVAEVLLQLGYSVRVLQSLAVEPQARPTEQNIITTIRTMASQMEPCAGLAAFSTPPIVVIYFTGNGLVNSDTGKLQFMLEEASIDRPQNENLLVSTLVSPFDDKGSVAVFADIANVYQLQADLSVMHASSGAALVTHGAEPLALFQQPHPGGLMTYYLLNALRTGGGRPASHPLTLESVVKDISDQLKPLHQVRQPLPSIAPESLVLADEPASAAQSVNRRSSVTGAATAQMYRIVIDAILDRPNETTQQLQTDSSIANAISAVCGCPNTLAQPSSLLGRVALLLKGNYSSCLRSGSLAELPAQLDWLVGHENNAYELRTATPAGTFRLLINLPLPTNLATRRSLNPNTVIPTAQQLMPGMKKPRVRSMSIPRANQDTPMPTKKPVKPAPKARSPPPNRKELPEPPATANPINPMHAAWESIENEIQSRIAAMDKKLCKFGGLESVRRAVGRCVELQLFCTPEQYTKLDGAVRAGQLVDSGVLVMRKKKEGQPWRRLQAVKGLIWSEVGDTFADTLKAFQKVSEKDMAEQCECKRTMNAFGMGQTRSAKGGGSLIPILRKCTSGDILELAPGRYTGPLTVDIFNVTIRGVPGPMNEEIIIESDDERSPTIDMIGNACRLENLTIVGNNAKQPAVIVRRGTPEVFNCHIVGQFGCVRVETGASPLFQKCVLRDNKKGPAVVFHASRGILEECEIRNNEIGVMVTGRLSDPWIGKCLIHQNRGAGVIVEDHGKGIFVETTVTENGTHNFMIESGGLPLCWWSTFSNARAHGIYVKGGGGRFENCTFSGNVDSEINVLSSPLRTILRHNRFYRLTWEEAGGRESADIGITVSSSDVVMERNEMEMYRKAVWVKSTGQHCFVLVLNRIVVGREPDAQALKAEDNCYIRSRFNDYYYWGAEPADVVKSPIDINRHLPLSSVSLVEAANSGYCILVRQLVKEGVGNINQVDPKAAQGEGCTPLTIAIRNEDMAMVGLILDCKANVNLRDGRGWSPLHVAVHQQNVELVRLLLKYGADVNSTTADNGMTQLLVALRGNSSALLKLLLEAKANPNQPCDATTGATVLHVLARDGRSNVMEILHPYGMQVNAVTHIGATPLLVAIQYSKTEAVRWLMQHNADPLKATTEGNTPLFLAVRLGDLECVKQLLELGVPVDQPMGNGGQSIHLAAEYGQLNVLEFLIDQGKANVNALCDDGRTPLHHAVLHEQHACAELLISRGANVDLVDANNLPARAYANRQSFALFLDPFLVMALDNARSANNCQEIFDQKDRILKEGPKLRHPVTGWTPLMQAVLFCNRRVAQYLVEHGLDLRATCANGLSAMLWATWVNSEPVMNIVKTTGSRMNQADHEALTRLKAARGNDDTQPNYKIISMTAGEMINLATLLDKTTLHLDPRGPPPVNNRQSLLDRMAAAASDPWFNSAVVKPNLNPTAGDQSIIAFLVSIGQSVLWKQNPNNPMMDLLLWDAKFHIANRVAEGNTFPVQYMLALFAYTYDSDLCRWANAALRSGDADQLRVWKPFLFNLEKALQTLPDYVGEAYLCIPTIDFDVEVYDEEAAQIQFPTFNSATTDYRLLRSLVPEDDGVVIVIQSTHGKLVSEYSARAHECEVLFPIGAKFKVSGLLKTSTDPEENRQWLKARETLAGNAKEPGKLPGVIVQMKENF